MRACMSSYSWAYLRHRARTARAKRPSPRPSNNFAAVVSWTLEICGAEGQHNSSAVQAFFMGPSFGTGAYPFAVPAAHAGRVVCDAEARREPSRGVCSIFRITKRFGV